MRTARAFATRPHPSSRDATQYVAGIAGPLMPSAWHRHALRRRRFFDQVRTRALQPGLLEGAPAAHLEPRRPRSTALVLPALVQADEHATRALCMPEALLMNGQPPDPESAPVAR